MENISLEQIVKVNPPKKAALIKGAMILVTIFSLTLIYIPYVLILTIVLAIFTIVVFRYYDYEYEYCLVGKELTVDRIIAKSHRRKGGNFNIDKMEVMAPYNSKELLRYEYKKCRIINYSSNKGMDKTYVLYVPQANEMVCVLMDPNEKMLKAFQTLKPDKFFSE